MAPHENAFDFMAFTRAEEVSKQNVSKPRRRDEERSWNKKLNLRVGRFVNTIYFLVSSSNVITGKFTTFLFVIPQPREFPGSVQ